MKQPHDPNATEDIPASFPPDSLDAGLAAGFGRSASPRSSLGDSQPILLKEAEGESAHVVKPRSDAMPDKEEAGNRYQLSGEIARGGMGAVLRGRDVDLGRELAIKVLLEKYANRPDVAKRFIEEAQIGGQLQHPGVVPVYDIGRFGDRPYFTMKLVKGQTLAAILSERTDPSTDRPRLLGIALQVTQTLAYAHAKGVIHRDLKPANIMVGFFGEVQVMDWGLAKVLAEGGVADEERASRMHQNPEDVTHIRTARSTGTAGSHGSETEAGSLLGTPAYMPPEQANGETATLDRRADVFGLGAILCEILTGKPPYVGRSGEEIRRKAANGDLADATARLNACEAEAELIALTKQCLSPEAIDRPKDAQEVADRLTAYLDGVQERLQAAKHERAVAVVRETEQRKRRRVQLALAAAVMGLLMGSGSFAWWQTEQANQQRETVLRRQLADEQRAAADNARFARNAEAMTTLLSQCEDALRAGDAAKAEVALDAAKKRSAEGGAEKEAERLSRLEADLALLGDLDAVDLFRWTLTDNYLPDPSKVAGRTRDVLKRSGVDLDASSTDEAIARVSASVVRERIITALDRLIESAGARALLRKLDANPYRDAVRDAHLAKNWVILGMLAGQPDAIKQPPGFVVSLGENLGIPVEWRRRLLKMALVQQPGNLSLLMTMGGTYPMNREEGADERLRWYQAAVAAAPTNAVAYASLAEAMSFNNQLDEGVACHRKAIELDPKFAAAFGNLGNRLREMDRQEKGNGRLNEVIACYRKALELDPKNAVAHSNLGCSLMDKGNLDEAIACLRKAIELDPHSAPIQHNLGNALKGVGRLDEAIACYRKALGFDPKFVPVRVDLGVALMEKGNLEEAITCYRKVLELEPKSVHANVNLGNVLNGMGRRDEAIACYRKAVEAGPKIAAAHYNLGIALKDKGQSDEAIACFRKAIEFDPKFALAHINLGDSLFGKGRMDEAIVCYRKTIQLDPKFANAYANMGTVLASQGQLDEAIASLRKSIELNPKNALTHAQLGSTLLGNAQLDEAIACFRKSTELQPNSEQFRKSLADAERLGSVRDKLPSLLKGEYSPASNGERLSLAEWCQIKKLYRTATGLYDTAFKADPKLADDLSTGCRWNAACVAALAANGQGDAALLTENERASLRKQCLDWLRADLAIRTLQFDSSKADDRAWAQQALLLWQQKPDLASIRDAAALAKLPADEQKAFTQLWTDVASLLKKAKEKEK